MPEEGTAAHLTPGEAEILPPQERLPAPVPEEGTAHLTPGEARILLLQERFPAPLFHKAVWLLLNNQSSSLTTNLILLEPDRGHLQEWRFETLYPLISALNARLQGWLSCPNLELAPEWLREVLAEWNARSR